MTNAELKELVHLLMMCGIMDKTATESGNVTNDEWLRMKNLISKYQEEKEQPEVKGDLISRSALKKALKSNCIPELCHDYSTAWCESCCRTNDFEDLIDNAPTVEPQKIVTIPHELIEKLVLCVVDTVENIDWDKAIEAYKERPQVTVFTETADEKAVADLKAELQSLLEARPLEARPQGEYVDISKLRLMTVEECEGHTVDYARGWRACIEWIKRGCAE